MIDNAQASNMTDNVESYDVDARVTDAATGQKETTYQNSEWSTQWGWFNSNPELHNAILMKAIWNVGKGYNSDSTTKAVLDHITGWGKDTFEDVLFNMQVIKYVNGDSYAEIIRSDEGLIQNLKPLDPSTIRVVVDEKGIIKRYEQTSKNPQNKDVKKFEVEDILHFSNNRLADQIHGISVITALEDTLKADNESFKNAQTLSNRQARPLIMFKLGTDDETKIDTFVTKMDRALNNGENLYIPDDSNSVSYDVVKVDLSAMLLQWRAEIRNRFYRALGLPLILFGTQGSTESGGKMEYLAHEQIFEKEQHEIERQIEQQLNIKIDLISPTSMLENLQQDASKDGAAQQLNLQASDMNAARGR